MQHYHYEIVQLFYIFANYKSSPNFKTKKTAKNDSLF